MTLFSLNRWQETISSSGEVILSARKKTATTYQPRGCNQSFVWLVAWAGRCITLQSQTCHYITTVELRISKNSI